MKKNEYTLENLIEDLKLTPEEEEEIRLEEELIEATIKARKESNLTQRQLSEKTGIKQPAIARIEKFRSSPQVATLMKLLYPLGYTLKIVPIKNKKSKI